MKYIVTKRVSIISLSTKKADSWNKPRAGTISQFLLHAAYEELNLIQIVYPPTANVDQKAESADGV